MAGYEAPVPGAPAGGPGTGAAAGGPRPGAPDGVPSPGAGDPHGRRRALWNPERAVVLAQERRGPDWYKLTLRAPYVAAHATAGQFVETAVHPAGGPGLDPLLKRPLSICELRPDDGVITLIYRSGPGRGTRALARVQAGQELDLLGPLGRSFPDPARRAGPLYLVGGGIGLPPMVAAAAWALAAGREVRVIAAARSQDGLAGLDELAATGVPVTVVTDDGSAGRRALATEPLAEWLGAAAGGAATGGAMAGGAMAGAAEAGRASPSPAGAAPGAEVWACGPEPMLVAVKGLCAQRGAACFLSLERFMGCGFGVCMSCTVPRAAGPGYLKCCTDGPVFPAGEVILNGE